MRVLDANPALAELQAREILKVLPHDVRATFIIGAALRRRGDADGARAILEPLAQGQPKSAYAHYELGLTLARLGEAEAAVAALHHAAALRQDLPQTWLSLSDQLRLAGDVQGAATAYAEHIRTTVSDPDVREAAALIRDARLADAEQILRRHVIAHPDDVPALRLLGETVGRMGHREEAEDLLAHCLTLAPDFDDARHSYALILYHQNKIPDAIRQLERLVERSPKDLRYLALLGASCNFVMDYERAIATLETAIAQHPSEPQLWICYGQSLRVFGRQREAREAFERALTLRPTLGEAYWSLADLKTVGLTGEAVERMRGLIGDPTLSPDDRLHLHYALGKALEDAKAWAESFEHYAVGAKLRRAQLPYDADQNTAWAEMSKAHFTAEFFAARASAGAPDAAPSPTPIFIVGLPRSGSTLVEQILAAHSEVEATMELPELIHLCNRLLRRRRRGEGPGYLELTALLTPAERAALGAEYLDHTQGYRKLGRALFIDKMPGNFFQLGMIRLILPQAKVIDVRRHPMAAGFSAFKQHFFRGHEFSYDLGDTGRYYADYVSFMAHFDRVLPGFVHRVIYEDLVEDPEAEVRRLLAYCGLPFEEGCLRHWESGRPVSTHSSEQVRGPIFRDGLEQWRHYEPWLGPLREAVAPALPTWRGERGG
jgi:predicted Zn-dependent protease